MMQLNNDQYVYKNSKFTKTGNNIQLHNHQYIYKNRKFAKNRNEGCNWIIFSVFTKTGKKNVVAHPQYIYKNRKFTKTRIKNKITDFCKDKLLINFIDLLL